MDLAGKTFVFLGRLRRSTWNDAARSVAQAGGTVRRGLSRRADIAVVGHGAHVLLDDGRLTGRIAAAEASTPKSSAKTTGCAASACCPPSRRQSVP